MKSNFFPPLSFVAIFGSGIRDPGSGMGKNQDPGSGINIPDPQHWFGIRDPGSGKSLFRIPDPEVKKAPDPGSGSATLIFEWFF
jgi:hypothetical protein